jgi:pilus assembly protein Flp/PilA
VDTSTNALKTLWNRDEGLTVVEYAIAGGLVAAALITAFLLLGRDVSAIITFIHDQLNSNSPAL